MEKKVGIVVDNYKLDKFKEELTKEGFLNFEVLPLRDNTSVIRVFTTQDKLMDVARICKRMELHFKQSN